MIGRIALSYEAACRVVLTILVVGAALLLFTLRGAVVAGVFPSVAAALSTYRCWLRDDERSWSAARTFRVFAAAWRAEFPRANAPGAATVAVAVLLWVDHRLLEQLDLDTVGFAVSGLFVVVSALAGVVGVLFWVLRAHFDEPALWVLPTAASMVIARPLCTGMLLGVGAITVWAASVAPAVVLVFGPSGALLLASTLVFAFGRIPGLDVRERAARLAHPHT